MSSDPTTHEEDLSVRAIWEVTAGVTPDIPLRDRTKQFFLLTRDVESPYQSEIFTSRMIEAMEYAKELHNPRELNWVNLKMVWY